MHEANGQLGAVGHRTPSPQVLNARCHRYARGAISDKCLISGRSAKTKGVAITRNSLILLAPRPGLEPGTYGLTGYRSICPLTRMNARFAGFVLPIYFVRFTSGRPGKGRSEPLDIGSLESMVFTPVDGRPQRDLERIGAAGQDGLETQIGGFKPGFPRLAVWRRNPDEK